MVWVDESGIDRSMSDCSSRSDMEAMKMKMNTLMMVLLMTSLWACQESASERINDAMIDVSLPINIDMEQAQSPDSGEITLDATVNVDATQQDPADMGEGPADAADQVDGAMVESMPDAGSLTECILGQYRSNGQCTPCTQPSAGQFALSLCTDEIDTVVSNCTVPMLGEYVTDVCTSGSALMLGANTQMTACSTVDDGSYVTTACVPGDSSTLGSNTTTTACSAVDDGSYVTTACVPGDSSTLGSDTTAAACSAVDDGSYVDAAVDRELACAHATHT
jgi:hypothetical protein